MLPDNHDGPQPRDSQTACRLTCVSHRTHPVGHRSEKGPGVHLLDDTNRPVPRPSRMQKREQPRGNAQQAIKEDRGALEPMAPEAESGESPRLCLRLHTADTDSLPKGGICPLPPAASDRTERTSLQSFEACASARFFKPQLRLQSSHDRKEQPRWKIDTQPMS